MKILIVDDNVAVQEIIKDILVDEGHNVRLASTVDEAVEKAKAFEPDVIMLDTKVGEDDGLRVVSRIYEEEPDRQIKVILIKGVNEQVPKDNPHIKGHIDKPFKSTDVLDALKDVSDVIVSDTEDQPKKKGRRGLFSRRSDRIQAPSTDISDMGVVFGRSYVIFEPRAEDIYSFIGLFDPEEYSILIVTPDKAKAVRERFSYDGIDVLSMSSNLRGGTVDIHGLGTIMVHIKSFVEEKHKPVIVFDKFGDMVEADGLNSMLLFMHQLIRDDYPKDRTYAVSVDKAILTDNDRSIMLHDMTEYKF